MLNIPEEIKQLFRQGSVRKNLRVHFPNGERGDITNSNLLAESFSFTESIMSQSELKFGLCESSMIEFDCFGVENIKYCEIEVFHEIDISGLSEDFIAEHGIMTADVPFPYYRIPYGRFTVDSCPRQSNMNHRNVTAYTQDIQSGIPLSGVEKAKQKSTVLNNVPYEFDLIQFLFSNIPGLTNYEEYLNKTEISIEESTGVIESFKNMIGGVYTLSATGIFIRIVPGDELEKGLLKIGFNPVFNFNEIKKEFLEVTSQYLGETIVYALGPFVRLYDDKDSSLIYYGKKRTNGISTGNMIYPYISGKQSVAYPKEKEYFTICIPKKLIYSAIDESGSFTKEWTIAEDYSVEFLTPKEGMYNPTLSFDRTKVATNQYNFQGKIELVKQLSAWLEINALFAKYARDGGIELINLQKRMELYPSEYLYPSDELYPIGYEHEEPTSELITEEEYQNGGFWYEEYQVQPFGKVAVDYIDLEGNKQTFVYRFDDESPNIYYMDNNEIFKTVRMDEADVKALLDTYFIPNANDTVFTPVELKMNGRPDIEAGDYLNIVSQEGNIFTFVMRRLLTGIQALTDEVEAEGNEYNEDTTDTSLIGEGEN